MEAIGSTRWNLAFLASSNGRVGRKRVSHKCRVSKSLKKPLKTVESILGLDVEIAMELETEWRCERQSY